MGFEYRIITTLSEADKNDALKLIEEKQFNRVNATDGWPDMFIEVETDGIYVCKNRTSDLWEGLEELRMFLKAKGIKYLVEEI